MKISVMITCLFKSLTISIGYHATINNTFLKSYPYLNIRIIKCNKILVSKSFNGDKRIEC